MATAEFEPTVNDQDHLLTICEALGAPGEIDREVRVEADKNSGRFVVARAADKPSLLELVTYIPDINERVIEESVISIAAFPPGEEDSKEGPPKWYLTPYGTLHLGNLLAGMVAEQSRRNVKDIFENRFRGYLALLAEASEVQEANRLRLADVPSEYLQLMEALQAYTMAEPLRFETTVDAIDGPAILDFTVMAIRRLTAGSVPLAVRAEARPASTARLLLSKRSANTDALPDETWDILLHDRPPVGLEVAGKYNSRYSKARDIGSEDIITAMIYAYVGLERLLQAAAKYQRFLQESVPEGEALSAADLLLVRKFYLLQAAGVVAKLPEEFFN